MPEGHTVHRIVKYQRRMLAKKELAVTSPQKRFAAGAKQVSGRTLRDIEPLGKHLFYHFDNGRTVHVHLGMHGRYRYTKFDTKRPPPPIGQVRMRLVASRQAVDLTGPTVCEVLDEAGIQAIRDRIGPDLLDPAADREPVWEKIHKSRQAIGLLLMDQSVLSGIGNAYRSELLYRQKIDPTLPGTKLTRRQFNALWDDAVEQLKLGVRYGIMVTVEPKELTKPIREMKRADRDRFYVYRRSTCLRCSAKTLQYEVAGRTVYVCPREQLGKQQAAATPVRAVKLRKAASKKWSLAKRRSEDLPAGNDV